MQTHYTTAELRTYREIVGMTRNELADRLEVEEKHIRYWEKTKGRVPLEAAETLLAVIKAAGEVVDWLTEFEGILPRFAAADAHLCPVPDIWVWSCAINSYLRANPATRVVWFVEADYSDFCSERGLPHTLATLASWASDAVARQALPHSSDQPPAGF